MLWAVARRSSAELKPRDGVLLVVLTWTVLPLFASLPLLAYFYEAGAPISFTDAYFEAMSGLTTTGSTVLTGLDTLPPLGQPVALLPAVARRHGHPGARGRDPADARHGRQPAVPRRDGRSDQGCQAHAAHHRDCQGTVDDLCLHLGAVPARLPRWRHELVRRLGAHVRHHQPGRHEQPRCELRLLQLAAARVDRRRLHAVVQLQFRGLFRRHQQAQCAADRRRSRSCAARSGC